MNGTGIYMISSIKKPNRFYIGSAVNMKSRISGHVSALKKGKHHTILLQRHVNKYGISDLKYEVLAKVYDKENLLYAEQRYLNLFKPFFNTNPTAGSNMGRKFGPMSAGHKKKIADGNRGKVISRETIEGHEIKMHKYSVDGKVIKTYRSGIEAKRQEGLNIKACKGSNITIGGYVWVSENDEMPDFYLLQQRLIESKKALCRPVMQIDKDGRLVAEFEGVRIACKITGIDHRSISQVAAGSVIRKSAGGFIWKYKEVTYVA
jgi:group I intron endonuclease